MATWRKAKVLSLVVGVAAVLMLVCASAEAVEKKKKAKSSAEVGVPKGGNVSVEYGYHHDLENGAGSVTDSDANFHSPAIPAPGTSSSDAQQKTTTCDGGEANSEWDVTIDNALADPKHILIDITKLLSESTAPNADPFSTAVTKSSVKIDGQIVWSDDVEEKVTEKRKKETYIETKKELARKKKMKIPLRDAVKLNGFMGAAALGLIDVYADTTTSTPTGSSGRPARVSRRSTTRSRRTSRFRSRT